MADEESRPFASPEVVCERCGLRYEYWQLFPCEQCGKAVCVSCAHLHTMRSEIPIADREGDVHEGWYCLDCWPEGA